MTGRGSLSGGSQFRDRRGGSTEINRNNSGFRIDGNSRTKVGRRAFDYRAATWTAAAATSGVDARGSGRMARGRADDAAGLVCAGAGTPVPILPAHRGRAADRRGAGGHDGQGADGRTRTVRSAAEDGGAGVGGHGIARHQDAADAAVEIHAEGGGHCCRAEPAGYQALGLSRGGPQSLAPSRSRTGWARKHAHLQIGVPVLASATGRDRQTFPKPAGFVAKVPSRCVAAHPPRIFVPPSWVA